MAAGTVDTTRYPQPLTATGSIPSGGGSTPQASGGATPVTGNLWDDAATGGGSGDGFASGMTVEQMKAAQDRLGTANERLESQVGQLTQSQALASSNVEKFMGEVESGVALAAQFVIEGVRLTQSLGIVRTSLGTARDQLSAKQGELAQAQSFWGIPNGFANLFGGGVDVGALQAQIAELQGTVNRLSRREGSLVSAQERNEANRVANEEALGKARANLKLNEGLRDRLGARLTSLNGTIENNNATIQQYADAIQAAAKESGKTISNKDANKIAQTMAASGLTLEEIQKDPTKLDRYTQAIEAAANGEDINPYLVVALEESGVQLEAAMAQVAFFDLICNYKELGLDFDFDAFMNMSVLDFARVVEEGNVQNQMKLMGGGATGIVTQEDLDANAAAAKAFTTAYSTLEGTNVTYKQTGAQDIEVDGFLNANSSTYAGVRRNNLYDTTILTGLTSKAEGYTDKLKSETGKSNGGEVTEVQFITLQSRTLDRLDSVVIPTPQAFGAQGGNDEPGEGDGNGQGATGYASGFDVSSLYEWVDVNRAAVTDVTSDFYSSDEAGKSVAFGELSAIYTDTVNSVKYQKGSFAAI